MAGCASPSLSPEVCVFWAVSAFCALTLQSQPSSDTSSCTGAFLPFGAWLFGSSSGVTFLFFQYVNIIYCLFGSWQQCGFFFFWNHECSLGWSQPSLGSSGWCWFVSVCLHCRGIRGYTLCYPWKELIILCLYRRSREGLDEQSLFIPPDSSICKMFCTGDRYPRGVKLLFANFSLEICVKFGMCLVTSFFVFVF